MKKFTLLAGMALIAGSAFAKEEVNGLIMSDPANNDYTYYRISNMRVQRLSYITGACLDENGDSIARDGGMTPGLPQFMPDGVTPTPELYDGDNKYAGLSLSEGKWWLAFSSIPEVVNPNTRFWYFTKGKVDGTVYIRNIVQEGSLSRKSASTLGRPNMLFDTKENQYFVLPMEDALISEGFEMSLTDEELHTAFALSTSREVTAESTSCIDMSNYITQNYSVPKLDELGDTMYNENDEVVYEKYGFAGAKIDWSPLKQNGSNDNHLNNNGSLWFVAPADAAEAQAALEAYRQVIIDSYKEGAEIEIKQAYANIIPTLEGYQNLPGLVKNQSAIAALIAMCENPTVNVDNITDLASQEAAINAGVEKAKSLLIDAAAQIGKGCVVRLQNQFALRDYPAYAEYFNNADQETIDTLALGNAWIAAGQKGWFWNGSSMEAGYPGIGPVIESTPDYDADLTRWELIPVEGTATFKLYNEKTKSYIMDYSVDTLAKMTAAIIPAEELVENPRNYTWATTENIDDAQAFSLVGCPDDEGQAELTEAEQGWWAEYELDYNLSTSVIDNVRLSGVNKAGNSVNIHRAGSGSSFKFENYGAEQNRWYAQSNAFHVEVLVEGGINEIAADQPAKAQGIYDLQGRRVSKAGKGLYIINGVKTIVR